MPEQVCRQGMMEQVRSFPSRIDTSAYQRSPDDCGNGDGVREATNGSIMSKENPATGTVRPAGVQIERDGLTDVGRQRQLCPTSALSPDCDPAVVPIDVLQVQRNDLAGSQTQPGQHQ